jgi:hypothetical protein
LVKLGVGLQSGRLGGAAKGGNEDNQDAAKEGVAARRGSLIPSQAWHFPSKMAHWGCPPVAMLMASTPSAAMAPRCPSSSSALRTVRRLDRSSSTAKMKLAVRGSMLRWSGEARPEGNGLSPFVPHARRSAGLDGAGVDGRVGPLADDGDEIGGGTLEGGGLPAEVGYDIAGK